MNEWQFVHSTLSAVAVGFAALYLRLYRQDSSVFFLLCFAQGNSILGMHILDTINLRIINIKENMVKKMIKE